MVRTLEDSQTVDGPGHRALLVRATRGRSGEDC